MLSTTHARPILAIGLGTVLGSAGIVLAAGAVAGVYADERASFLWCGHTNAPRKRRNGTGLI